MRSDCCRTDGSAPAQPLPTAQKRVTNFERGSIPGAVPGCIPSKFAASRPIYLDGPVTLNEFLVQSIGHKSNQNIDNNTTADNNLDMSPPRAKEESFLWPVTSRFSFVAAFSLALLVALTVCSQTRAAESEGARANTSNKIDSGNLKIATKTESSEQMSGREISFVCGRPNTLQALAPMDLPVEKAVRFLPQGASPIAEMKFMPAAKPIADKNSSARPAVSTRPDTATNDRMYQRLMKLSLADPSVYQAEGSSLITYFSILTGGQDQKRVDALQRMLEETLNNSGKSR